MEWKLVLRRGQAAEALLLRSASLCFALLRSASLCFALLRSFAWSGPVGFVEQVRAAQKQVPPMPRTARRAPKPRQVGRGSREAAVQRSCSCDGPQRRLEPLGGRNPTQARRRRAAEPVSERSVGPGPKKPEASDGWNSRAARAFEALKAAAAERSEDSAVGLAR